MSNLLIAYGNLKRHRCYLVGAVYDIVLWCIIAKIGKRRAHVNFDTLGHTLADAHVVLTTHILLNVGCEVVTGDAQ